MSVYDRYQEPVDLLKALAHPVRMCIVVNLMQERRNVKRMRECLDIPQSSVSQQLAILKAQGIVTGERKGNEVCYSVVDEKAENIINLILDEFGIDIVED
ncbi:MAG TPA: metalloregulator ArsR/SmtB family transcription factor [Clostridia bacterium]|nr:metalloregulator ArsR/SmtB family transcription factor [Clostridia bacterium]